MDKDKTRLWGDALECDSTVLQLWALAFARPVLLYLFRRGMRLFTIIGEAEAEARESEGSDRVWGEREQYIEKGSGLLLVVLVVIT